MLLPRISFIDASSNSIVSPSIKLHLNFPEKILIILINEKTSLLLPIFILVAPISLQ